MARVCFSSISKAVEKFILDILKTCIQGWVNGCGTCKSLFLELRLYQNMDNHKNDVHVSMVNKRSKRGSVRGDGRMKYRRCRMVCIWPRGGVSRAWFVLIVWNNIPHPHVLEKREREREDGMEKPVQTRSKLPEPAGPEHRHTVSTMSLRRATPSPIFLTRSQLPYSPFSQPHSW